MSVLLRKIESNQKLNSEDFLNEDVRGLDLRNIIIPEDKFIFQKIKNKDLSNVKLPYIDMNIYDFSGVNFTGCIFSDNTIFSKDNNFFQKIKNKNLYFVSLPKWDFSNYNFSNVSLVYTEFKEGTIFPKNESFLLDLAIVKGVSFPKSFVDISFLYGCNFNILNEFIKFNLIESKKLFILSKMCEI